ncbi:MAG: DUF4097 family beta strand repeat-containing protein [Caulobacterales bacterium]
MYTFETPRPVRLRVELPKGRILVQAGEVAVTTVELVAIHGDPTALQWIAESEVAQHGDEIVVLVPKWRPHLFERGGAIAATIHAPAGSSLSLATGSGAIDTAGRFGDVKATSGSGGIRIAEAADAMVRTGSGDVTIEVAHGRVDAQSGSGNVAIGSSGTEARVHTGSGNVGIEHIDGEANVHSGSGDIHVTEAGDSLDAFSASGRVVVSRADHGRVRAKSVSGRVSVGVANGAAAWLDISTVTGRVNSALEAAAEPAEGERKLELRIHTVSGAVDVQRA